MKTERQPIIKRGVADAARPHATLPTVCVACVEERDHLEAIKREHAAERESWNKEKAVMARAHSQEVKRGNELQKQLAAASRKDADHEENLDLEAAKREHAAEREKWAKERAVMARQLSAEAKRGNDLERQLALATSRKGGDAEELAAVKKKLFAANAEAKKTEARFNAQESRHRLELREREVATLRASNDADRRAAEATARALEAEGAVAAAHAERDAAVDAARTAAAALRSLETKFAATVSAARAAQDEAQIRMERMHGEHLERVAFYEDRITRLERERHAEKENGLVADEVFRKLADFRLAEIREKGRLLASSSTQET